MCFTNIAQYKHYADLVQHEIAPALSLLRPGVNFKIDTPARDKLRETIHLQGACNTHIPITFEDGVTWLARLHNDKEMAFGKTSNMKRASELAAMQSAHSLAPEFVPATHIASSQNGASKL